MPLSRKHLLKQTATLLRLGVAEQDIARTASWIEAHLPEGADAATWIPSAADLQEDGVISEAAQVDARTAFYGNKAIPKRLRRILDARTVE